MESWCHASEGRGFMIPDEMDFPNDPYARNRRALTGWDRGFVDSREFLVPSCSELPKNPVYNDNTSIMMHRYSGLGVDSGRNVGAYASMIPSNSSMGSVSNRSNSIMGSSSQDSPPNDLKQGSIADHREAQNGNFLRDRPVFSSVSPTIQAKRARIVSIRSQTPFCQVYGCNKDLSSSKDYHRRHKVCELHSKTPKVIVNGIEQRFCQQCSRFHLLVEFDNGKRSCRKRLAGHNERRRKPQFVALPGRRHELLQSYKERCELANWHRHVKLEEESTHNPPTVTALTRASTLHLHGDRIPNTSRISVSPTEDLTAYNTASAAYDFTGMAQSSCALSLLSSELHDLSHLTRNMMVRSLCSHSNPNCRNVGTSDKLSVKRSFEKYAPNGSHWSKANSNQLKQMGSSVVAGAGHRTDLRVKVDGALVVESDLSNATVGLSSEEVPTVGLLQLSSHLQRVEQQRTIMQVKNENDDFCSFHATY